MKCQLVYLKNKKLKISSAADDSPEMSRLKISKKKINEYKLSFFVFVFALVVIGAIWIN